jgi:transposase
MLIARAATGRTRFGEKTMKRTGGYGTVIAAALIAGTSALAQTPAPAVPPLRPSIGPRFSSHAHRTARCAGWHWRGFSRHLARFVVEVVDALDLSAMVTSYRGTGSAGYHPALLLGLLVYGYANGVFSSRKLERATYDSVAFRFISANDHPDHDTIATFRRRFLKEIEALFVRVLQLAREMGLLKLGTVALFQAHYGPARSAAAEHKQFS